jgi:hypothetical protein
MANIKYQIANSEWRIANGKWQISNIKWQMANGKWQSSNIKYQMANDKWQFLSLFAGFGYDGAQDTDEFVALLQKRVDFVVVEYRLFDQS